MGPHIKESKTLWNLFDFTAVCFMFTGYGFFWEFPVQVINNSPQYFLLYHLTLIAIGIPIFYVSLKLGNTGRCGVVNIFAKYLPFFRGIGVTLLIMLFITTVKQQVRASYFLYYCYSALKQSLPYRWSKSYGSAQGDLYLTRQSQYFYSQVLRLSEGIDSPGPTVLHLGSGLVISWLVVFIFTLGGIRTFGKMILPASVGAIVLCLALIAYGWEDVVKNPSFSGSPFPLDLFYSADHRTTGSLDTSSKGFTEVWIPCIYSVITWCGLWSGVLPTMGRCIGNSLNSTTFHKSWVILWLVLSVLPHLFVNVVAPYIVIGSHALELDEKYVVALGNENLPFEIFPLLITFLRLRKGCPFVIYVVGFMFIVLRQALFIAVIIDNIFEKYRRLISKCISNEMLSGVLLSGIICFLGAFLGLPITTQGGYYVFLLIEEWINKALLFIILFTVLVYTASFVQQDYSLVEKILMTTWFILAGLCSACLMAYYGGFHEEYKNGYAYKEEVKGVEYTYPRWAYAMGWFVAFGPLVLGLTVGFILGCIENRDGAKRLCHSCALFCCLVGDGFSEEAKWSGYGEPRQSRYGTMVTNHHADSRHTFQSNGTYVSSNTMQTSIPSLRTSHGTNGRYSEGYIMQGQGSLTEDDGYADFPAAADYAF